MEQTYTFTIESKKQNIDTLTEEQQQEFKAHAEECQIIVLKGNSYSKQFFNQFSEYITTAKQLQKINANDIFVGKGKDEIPQSLQILGNSLIGLNILSLDLSNNAVNPFGAEALKPFLKQAHQLQKLFLNNCGLGIRGVAQVSEGLQEGEHNLQILAIARNRAECDGAIEISKAFPTCKKLKELHIYQNGIKQKGMMELLQSLNNNCSELTTIDIRDNFVHEATTQVLSDLIINCAHLTAINISDCNIQGKQNKQILEALTKLVKIERLGYNYAELNDVQGNELYEIIAKQVDNITKLELKGNEFKKATKQKFKELFATKDKVLGAFDSDDEDEEEADELQKLFSQLVI
ncbi:unnamed protein product [Paramecium primaurelia]|uniref:Ran GTPase-activating protein n=1 Tax=Paramecium primaurelia TaxID=5886 RepID=A0A8S1L575_PARPR|nr:unnamed protein product [Paramecium primaurelia]